MGDPSPTEYYMLNRRGRVSRPFNFLLAYKTDRGFFMFSKKMLKN